MTDMYVMKAVVKLPPRNRQSTLMEHGSRYDPMPKMGKSEENFDTDFLVSNKLYLKDLPLGTSEEDILDVIGDCDPVKVQLHNDMDHVTGWLTFPNREKADRAYTLFNGAHFRNGVRLQLSIYPPNDPQEPEAMSGILQIRNLPSYTTNKLLYQWFRPWGPMNLCKIIIEQENVFKGTALVQYFKDEDADAAVDAMNNKNVQGSIISIFPFVGRMQPQSSNAFDRQSISERSSYTMINDNSNGGVARSPPYYSSGSSRTDSHSMVDYTNLYIKNLDLNVKSSDLFNHFRKFGRIISARVMKNTQTKQSKGFGFVSFSKTEEAHRALQEMDGINILSKPVIVAFHEPKKPRSEKSMLADQQLSHGGLSPPPSSFSPPLPSVIEYQRTHDPHKRYSTPNGIGYGSPLSNTPSMPIHPQSTPQDYIQQHKHQSQHQTPPFTPYPHRERSTLGGYQQTLVSYPHITNEKYPKQLQNGYKPIQPLIHITNSPVTSQQSHPHQPMTAHCAPPSLSTLASGAYINTPPTLSIPSYPQYKITPQGRPTLRRRGSVESISSVMTETSSNVQRQRMRSAVLNCCGNTDALDDIVDMLLTLKRKERSLCLFNSDILKAKIDQAKGALEIFQDDDDIQNIPALGVQKKADFDFLPKQNNAVPVRLSVPPRGSRAIPIVAPPTVRSEKAGTTTAVATTTPPTPPSGSTKDQELHQEVGNFLKTLEGLAVHEKKQKLGDRLFPLVKATGIKHAPKITIRLLDSVPLDELAHSMYDKAKLRSKVDSITSDE